MITLPSPTIRPLTPDDGRAVGLLIAEIHNELGTKPMLSVEAHVHLFQTPWLAKGAGLALLYGNTLCGYGFARQSEWPGGPCIQVGLALRRGFRTTGAHEVLTRPLIELARQLGQDAGIEQAVVFSRSVDTIHPPILAALGFQSHPLSLLGFSHNLTPVPDRPLAPGFHLRSARLPDDLELIESLAGRIFTEPTTHGRPLHRSYYEFEMTLSGFLPDQLMIVEAGSDPVGYVFLTRQCGTDGDCLMLSELGVLPALRRRGIGSALICHTLRWARLHGSGQLLTACLNQNPVAALYWRLGFRPDPLRTYIYYTRCLTD